jgi:hypothetical protein
MGCSGPRRRCPLLLIIDLYLLTSPPSVLSCALLFSVWTDSYNTPIGLGTETGEKGTTGEMGDHAEKTLFGYQINIAGDVSSPESPDRKHTDWAEVSHTAADSGGCPAVI